MHLSVVFVSVLMLGSCLAAPVQKHRRPQSDNIGKSFDNSQGSALSSKSAVEGDYILVSRDQLAELLGRSGDLDERGLFGDIANATKKAAGSSIADTIGKGVEHIIPDLRFLATDESNEQTGVSTNSDLVERASRLLGDIANVTKSGVKSGIISKIGDTVEHLLPDILESAADDRRRGLKGSIGKNAALGAAGLLGSTVLGEGDKIFHDIFNRTTPESDSELDATVADRLTSLPVNEDFHISKGVKTVGKIAGGGVLSGLGSFLNISSIF